jgi:hypothetical protein
LPEFLSDTIDGVFLITAETENAVNDEAHHLLNLIGPAISIVHDETGKARPGLERGHEHFGWLDGVSQPGVKGLTNAFPGQRLLDPDFSYWDTPPPLTGHPASSAGLGQNGFYGVPAVEPVGSGVYELHSGAG